MSAIVKSRATGCTSAEYDRPVSLRSSRSWMPARKSWASRIIGLRLVRAIAVSTSISTDASVPWTISTSTGSAPASASSVRKPYGNWVGARLLMGPPHDQVAVVVDGRGEAGVDRHGRAELLDDRRTQDDGPGTEV